MNRGVDPVRAENDRKDLLILRLKADVFELRQRDRDYKLLHEHFIQLRHQSQRQLEEKVSDLSSNTHVGAGGGTAAVQDGESVLGATEAGQGARGPAGHTGGAHEEDGRI